jgi:hypothetical protein
MFGLCPTPIRTGMMNRDCLLLTLFRGMHRWKCCGGSTVETATLCEMQVDPIGELSIAKLNEVGLAVDLPGLSPFVFCRDAANAMAACKGDNSMRVLLCGEKS